MDYIFPKDFELDLSFVYGPDFLERTVEITANKV